MSSHMLSNEFDDVVHGSAGREDGVVRAGKNREADDLYVFLQRSVDDHFGRLAEAGVNDFHAGVAQGAGNYFGAAVVAVETGLGDEDADVGVRHRVHLITEGAGSTGVHTARRSSRCEGRMPSRQPAGRRRYQPLVELRSAGRVRDPSLHNLTVSLPAARRGTNT